MWPVLPQAASPSSQEVAVRPACTADAFSKYVASSEERFAKVEQDRLEDKETIKSLTQSVSSNGELLAALAKSSAETNELLRRLSNRTVDSPVPNTPSRASRPKHNKQPEPATRS